MMTECRADISWLRRPNVGARRQTIVFRGRLSPCLPDACRSPPAQRRAVASRRSRISRLLRTFAAGSACKFVVATIHRHALIARAARPTAPRPACSSAPARIAGIDETLLANSAGARDADARRGRRLQPCAARDALQINRPGTTTAARRSRRRGVRVMTGVVRQRRQNKAM
jgi:hypothetical protein